MFAYIDQWLGCLDQTTYTALVSLAFECVFNPLVTYFDYFAVVDATNPDGYPGGVAFTDAFATVFGLTYGVIETEDSTQQVYFMNDPLAWHTSAILITQYPSYPTTAPCTQRTFP